MYFRRLFGQQVKIYQYWNCFLIFQIRVQLLVKTIVYFLSHYLSTLSYTYFVHTTFPLFLFLSCSLPRYRFFKRIHSFSLFVSIPRSKIPHPFSILPDTSQMHLFPSILLSSTFSPFPTLLC